MLVYIPHMQYQFDRYYHSTNSLLLSTAFTSFRHFFCKSGYFAKLYKAQDIPVNRRFTASFGLFWYEECFGSFVQGSSHVSFSWISSKHIKILKQINKYSQLPEHSANLRFTDLFSLK